MVGSDSRAGLSEEERKELATGNAAASAPTRSCCCTPAPGPNLLMSIPRDSMVDIPGHGTTKINAAYAFGGPKLLVETIEEETGIRIDQYVEIGLGGVVEPGRRGRRDRDLPEASMKDPLARLDIKKGCQEVDGATRSATRGRGTPPRIGDITRAKHQREVVSAVGYEVLSPWTFINPVRYWRLANAMPDFFAFGEGMGPVGAGGGRWR